MSQTILHKLLGLDLRRNADLNAWFLAIEIFWASFINAAASFNAAFVLRLGGTNQDIGLLTSLPALLAIAVSLPAGYIIQNLENRKPWVIGSLAIHRGGFLFLVLLPFLAGTSLPLGPVAVWILIIIGIPAHFFNIGFIPLLADTISEGRRAAVFSARQVVYNAAVSILIFGMGQWLQWAAYPYNYQLMYLVGILTSFVSIYYLVRLRVPPSPKPYNPPARFSLIREVKMIRNSLVATPQFAQIVRNTFLYSFGLWTASPLYILFYMRVLKAEESWLGLNGTVVSVMTIFAYIIWRRWIHRLGENKTLKLTIFAAAAYPLLVGLSPNLTFVLLAGVFYAFFNAGVGLSHTNVLMRTMPAESRPQYTAYWTALMNSGAFIAPLIGVKLADQFGLSTMLVICGITAIIGASSFALLPIRIGEPMPDTEQPESPEPDKETHNNGKEDQDARPDA